MYSFVGDLVYMSSLNESDASAGAGPSRQLTRLPKGPHPSSTSKRRKLAPRLPPKTTWSSHPDIKPDGTHRTLPVKTLQGRRTRRSDGSHPGYGRQVVFVTRKVSLGALMGRCRSLVVDEG